MYYIYGFTVILGCQKAEKKPRYSHERQPVLQVQATRRFVYKFTVKSFQIISADCSRVFGAEEFL
jgi:hypothetical protein